MCSVCASGIGGEEKKGGGEGGGFYVYLFRGDGR